MLRKPSTAEVTEMGGVITTIGQKEQPRLAWQVSISHLLCLLTSAYNEKMPPSPRLSAFKVSTTYFRSGLQGECPDYAAQKSPVPIFHQSSGRLVIAFRTYNGDSSNIAINNS